MNFRELEYIIAVAEHLHFGAAAKACFVGQPTLSMQIKKVEDYLGVLIFERNNKHILITEAGNEIVASAKRVITEMNALKTSAAFYKDPYAGEMVIGLFPTLAAYLLPKVAKNLAIHYPNLKVRFVEEKSNVLKKRLLNGEIDAIFLATEVNDDRLISTHLFFDPFFLAIAKNHPLNQYHSKGISLDELNTETLMLLGEGHCLQSQIREITSQNHIQTDPSYHATSLETLRATVAMGSCVTMIPEIARKDNDGLSYIPILEKNIGRDIAFVYRKASPRKSLMQGLIALAKQCK